MKFDTSRRVRESNDTVKQSDEITRNQLIQKSQEFSMIFFLIGVFIIHRGIVSRSRNSFGCDNNSH
jgi:hypothetical protein